MNDYDRSEKKFEAHLMLGRAALCRYRRAAALALLALGRGDVERYLYWDAQLPQLSDTIPLSVSWCSWRASDRLV